MKFNLNIESLPLRFRPACWRPKNLRKSLWLSLWLCIGLVVMGFAFAGIIYQVYAYTGTPLTWKQAWRVGFMQWYSWTFLGASIFWLTRRLPIERQRWLRGVLAYITIAAFYTFLKFGIDLVLMRLFYEGQALSNAPERSIFAIMLYFNLLTCGAIIAVAHAFNFYKELRERELKASQLQAQLAQAQLQALKMQLHPHFLFNTLHTISMLNLKDPKAANRMITRLSDLLRMALDNVGAQEVSLKQELAFLERYLEIEQIRFQDRLTVKMEIDPQTLDARVPNLILQPIVENAIRHGIAAQEQDGRIELCAHRLNGSLELKVRDNGPGLSAEASTHLNSGIGLTNTRKRLDQLYGAQGRVELSNASGGGLEVAITLPWHAEAIKENGDG